MADIVLGKVGITPKGEYNAEAEYNYLDLVTSDGSSYIALKAGSGKALDNGEYWQLVAEKGKDGAGMVASDIGAVATTDIVDDLETDDSTKVLSAKQGKALKDLISTNVGDLETLTTNDKSSLVNATNEVKNLVDSNTQFTDADNVVYSWRFIKSAEGHMQLEYTEVI